ncbi:MAG: glycosyltransferase family 4 protein [Calditrichaeota bacterium]|nr:glycosyltransferase family 4 protein [Calditrichota bacterium]HQU73631.1 glycosyltransferase family 4 protein [Calditrichia bacterium]
MNILFFNSIGTTTWGGGEKWMFLAARGLRDKGHRVYVGGRVDSLFLRTFREMEFETLPLHITGDFGLINILKIRRFLLARGIDAVVANFNKDIRLTGIAGRLANRPAIIARSGALILRNNWRYRLSYRKLVDGILTNSLSIKKRYTSYPFIENQFVRVIYNGIDPHTETEYHGPFPGADFGMPDHRPVIGNFGRLVKVKQPLMFLEVAHRIKEDYPEALFLMVGDGPMRNEILSYAAQLGLTENLYLPGFQEAVFKFYSMCDLVLLTSEHEGQPNVIMEAMLAGKPVISFDVGGVSELIHSEETGIRVAPNDIYRMGEMALELLADEPRRLAIGEAARRFISRNFSVGVMVEKVEEYLLEVVRRRRPDFSG